MTTLLIANQPVQHPLETDAWKSDYPSLSLEVQTDFQSLRAPIFEFMSRLDRQIPELQAQLDRLQRERDRCAARMEKIDSALAPCKRLPVEILSKIFVHVRNEVPCQVPRPHTRSSPELVCGHWRRVALSTPALWRKVKVDLKDGVNAERITGLAHQVFPRGMQVLRVSALFTNLDVGVMRILQLVSPFSARIRRFRVDGNPLLLLRLSSQPLLPSFDALELVNFGAPPLDSGPVCAATSHAPRWLLAADPMKIMSIMRTVPALPWAQLTALSVSSFNISVPAAQAMLSQCIMLIDCTLTLVWDPITPDPADSITLNHLQHLRIVSVRADRSPVAAFLHPFILPSLSRLELVHPTYEIDENERRIQSVVQLLERSRCKLESFVAPLTLLRDSGDDELERLVNALSPTVEKLVLTQNVFPDVMVRRIGSGALLPRLSHIECRIESSLEGLACFLEMLESRWEGSCGLSRVQSATFRCLKVGLGRKEIIEMLERFNAKVDRFEEQGREIVFHIIG